MSALGGRATAFALAAVATALATLWLLFGRGALPIQTDLLAMLPATERDTLAETAVERLARANGDRMVLLVSGADADAKAAARALGQTLTAEHTAFASVTAELPPFELNSVVAPYLPHRFGLLDDAARAAVSAADFQPTAALARHLNQPFVDSIMVPLADDPFGWLGGWLAQQPWNRSPLTPEDNLLVAHTGDISHVLIIANLAGSAYDDTVQKAALAALDRAWAPIHTRYPALELARTGAVFYAAAARSGAERDMHRVGWISSLGIALLLLLVFRSPGPIGVAFLSTAIGVMTALCVSLLVFGEVYLLTLVFGAALLGEAVDYSIQYLTARANQGAHWDAAAGVRQVRPALLIALGTSLLGYALLGLVPFPPLKQMAVFAMSGMLVACLSVFWLLPVLLRRPARPITPWVSRAALALQAATARLAAGRRGWWLTGFLLLISLPGWRLLGHDDDIHQLIAPPAILSSDEALIRQVTGLGNGSQFFLVRGDSSEQVLEREEALASRLQTLVEQNELPGWLGLTQMVPSQQRQAANRAVLARWFDDPAALTADMVAAGFRADTATAYVTAWPGTPLAFADWMRTPIAQAFHHLWLDQAAGGPASIVVPQDAPDISALRAITKGLPGVELVDKPASVSDLFGRYRRYASWWLLAALLLITPVFAWRYGLRHAPRVLAPPALGIALTLAALGYLGEPLTLFHWLALMLVLGVGANYAVFLHEGEPFTHAQPGAMYASVLLSALTALLSFGLLSFSSMPALAHFGLTLLLGIAFTALLVPFSGRDTDYSALPDPPRAA
ncbi:MAG TPA: hypothetical protein VFN09_13360 [Rhodanobacteraceae bacterium]|nr:hypothetical protein [Rhodanobacteraceae bacterium]